MAFFAAVFTNHISLDGPVEGISQETKLQCVIFFRDAQSELLPCRTTHCLTSELRAWRRTLHRSASDNFSSVKFVLSPFVPDESQTFTESPYSSYQKQQKCKLKANMQKKTHVLDLVMEKMFPDC